MQRRKKKKCTLTAAFFVQNFFLYTHTHTTVKYIHAEKVKHVTFWEYCWEISFLRWRKDSTLNLDYKRTILNLLNDIFLLIFQSISKQKHEQSWEFFCTFCIYWNGLYSFYILKYLLNLVGVYNLNDHQAGNWSTKWKTKDIYCAYFKSMEIQECWANSRISELKSILIIRTQSLMLAQILHLMF